MSVNPPRRLTRSEYAMYTGTLLVVGYFSLWACTTEQVVSTYVGFGLTAATGVAGGIAVTIQLTKRHKAFLEENSPAIRQAIALGAGDGLRDLADLMEVPEAALPEFGRRLRANHTRLMPLLDPETLDDARAAEFYQIVEETLQDIPHAEPFKPTPLPT